MDDWVSVYSTNMLYNAELAKHMLADNQITAVIKNTQDSMYRFGSIELFVKQVDAIKAKHLISKFEE